MASTHITGHPKAAADHHSDEGSMEKHLGIAAEDPNYGEPAIIDPDAGKSPEERAAIDRKLLLRLDFYLIPWLCVLYLLAFLDRTNIGNAKIDGLPANLGIDSQAYNSTLTIFFVSYAVFEPLTNVLLKKWRPSRFIPAIMFAWGLCMTFMGFVTGFSGLMAARWFLGLCEAGLFPGINYYFSCWYKRKEFGIRAAIFFSAAAVSGSFGGLLAAAINKMDGVGNFHGWQWIFILEGLITVLFAVASVWVVQDFPAEAKFLSVEDRQRVLYRLSQDNQASSKTAAFSMRYFWDSVTDFKMWMGMIIYMGADMPLYAFSLFLPTIITGLGISTSSTINQLLTVPPYFIAACLTITVGWLADRMGQRGLLNTGVSCFAIIGFCMLIGSTDYKVQYAGTFLGAMGIYPCISNTISWVSNNIEGVYKRGVVLGFVIGWGNLNGIVSSNIYRAQDSPTYRLGHGVVLGYLVFFLFGGSIVNYLYLRRENNKRRAMMADTSIRPQRSWEDLDRLGDKRPDFIYTL